MTAVSKNKNKSNSKNNFLSSRAWAEDRLKIIKQLQDEYLDTYSYDKKESVQMLKLLNQIQKMLEKRL